MNIELGKTYQTRNGFKVKITNLDFTYTMPFFGLVTNGNGVIERPVSFNGAGMMHNHKESDFDLIKEYDIRLHQGG
jgi:hypothetical protein